MSGVLQETFTIIDSEKGEYTFKIPSIVFDIQVSYKAADIRRRAYPEALGVIGSIDFQAVQFSRFCAFFELYLTASTQLWPYGFAEEDVGKIDPQKPPVVNFEKFPTSAAETLYEVGGLFEEQYAQFRRHRNSDKRPGS